MNWNDIAHICHHNTTFLISSHVSMDGDSVGSQLAVYWYLRSLGKHVEIWDKDPVPRKFSFLGDVEVIHQGPIPQKSYDVFIILDCSSMARVGYDVRSLPEVRHIVNIDHHQDNKQFGDVNVVWTTSAATGELVYSFFESQGIDFPLHVAQALYTAIMTDTGGFRFSNTTARVFRICADLVERGVEGNEVYRRLFDSHTREGLILWSRVWSTLRYHFAGKVCTIELPLHLVDELGAMPCDTEGIADYTVMANGVEIGMFIKYNDHETHFSLRSRGHVDVGAIAQKVAGGGGHASAAGCTIPQPWLRAKEEMFSIIRRYV